jgi:hypothetical protein
MSKNHDDATRSIRRCSCPVCHRQPGGTIAREHRAINHLIACTDERSRRFVVGLLAHQYGHGGIALLSRITGLDRNTIARGQRELFRGDTIPAGRVRRPGAGRKRAETRSPES